LGYPPNNGDLVVAKIEDEGVLFKRFHHSGDGKFITLTSYNSVYPPLTLNREKLHWLYRVEAATQRF
jgi:SOS-response transcriptional repressor LexA